MAIKFFLGDKVIVYLSNGQEPFEGIVVEVNSVVAQDVWYKVTPIGEGVAQGRTFWHRESHIRRRKK
tara:strand:+ start:283 stop:483 length:201 start_codon:yes stop_codon:yes gene_type:complete